MLGTGYCHPCTPSTATLLSTIHISEFLQRKNQKIHLPLATKRLFPNSRVSSILQLSFLGAKTMPVIGFGDVVQLKPDGPVAMVVDILPMRLMIISWRDCNGTVYELIAPRKCLKRFK